MLHRAPARPLLLFAGIALLSVGLLFKVAAVPFHVWTPDVYQGAPTPVTALMAACTKVAAFGGLLRVLYVAFDRVQWDIEPVLGAIAMLTMLVGAILAVTQTDIKRLLAYSSIANAGYLLVGVLAFDRDGPALQPMFYLVAYGFTVIAAFAVVTLVRDEDGEATHLSRWAGLGRRSPLVAGIFTFLMLAFAGIPLTSGFTSKFAVFSAALGTADRGRSRWSSPACVTSMMLAFPYLRVVVMMWLSEPGENTPDGVDPGRLHLGRADGRRAGHAGARRLPGAGARPGQQRRGVPALTAPSRRRPAHRRRARRVRCPRWAWWRGMVDAW